MPPATAAPAPSLIQLYLAFQAISLRAFGGVLPWTRYELVERRRWLTEEEFTALLGVCQFLPGPNISNLSVAIGTRFRGPAGALAAFLGLYTMPLVIVLILAQGYARYGNVPAISGALNGVAAAAAGLIAAMALKMAQPLLKGGPWLPLAFIALTFAAQVGLHLSLLWTIPVLASLSILLLKKGE
jgi:chromate transporter